MTFSRWSSENVTSKNSREFHNQDLTGSSFTRGEGGKGPLGPLRSYLMSKKNRLVSFKAYTAEFSMLDTEGI